MNLNCSYSHCFHSHNLHSRILVLSALPPIFFSHLIKIFKFFFIKEDNINLVYYIYYAIKDIGHNPRLKEYEASIYLAFELSLREFLSLCTCTGSFAHADDAKIVRSWDMQCNTEKSPLS